MRFFDRMVRLWVNEFPFCEFCSLCPESYSVSISLTATSARAVAAVSDYLPNCGRRNDKRSVPPDAQQVQPAPARKVAVEFLPHQHVVQLGKGQIRKSQRYSLLQGGADATIRPASGKNRSAHENIRIKNDHRSARVYFLQQGV